MKIIKTVNNNSNCKCISNNNNNINHKSSNDNIDSSLFSLFSSFIVSMFDYDGKRQPGGGRRGCGKLFSSSLLSGSVSLINIIMIMLFFQMYINVIYSATSEWNFKTLINNNSRYGHCLVSIITLYNTTTGSIISYNDSESMSNGGGSSSSGDITYNNTLWVFGGYDQSFQLYDNMIFIDDVNLNLYQTVPLNKSHYNSSTNSGNSTDSSSQLIPLRWGHTCCQVGKDLILIFGGLTTDDNNNNTSSNSNGTLPTSNSTLGDLWSFNITSNKFNLLSNWSMINATVEINTTSIVNHTTTVPLLPEPRTRHVTSANSTHLFLFGGINSNGTVLGDFWIYNLIDFTWILVSNSTTTLNNDNNNNSPPPRWRHSSVFARGKFWIYGGMDQDGNALSDLWMYDIFEMKWSVSPNIGADEVDLARYDHLMDVDKKNDRGFLVYGGFSTYQLLDTWVYEFDESTWERLDVSSTYETPSTSSSSSMVYSSDLNSFVVFGQSDDQLNSGVWIYSLDCDCNNKGGCFYGLCHCFSGYFGDYCQYSIDGPIFLGLGIAISVPILCFGWCVLRCIPLPTRIKILTALLCTISCSLFISAPSCLRCWLPISIVGLISSLIGLYAILKSKGPNVLFVFIIGVFISIGCCIYGLGSFLPSCMLGSCRNETPDKSWLPKFAIIMDFVEGSLLVLILPLCIKLYRHRKLISNLHNNPMNSSMFSTTMTGLPPLIKQIESQDIKGRSETPEKAALNYLQKEHRLRLELSSIRISKLTEDLRIKINRNNVFEDTFEQLSKLSINQLIQNTYVKFIDEEGVDMGGLKKEWYSLLFKSIFDASRGLFIVNPNYTLSINPQSSNIPDHLALFNFVGKMASKSVLEGVHLEHTFSRIIYKLILGRNMSIDDLVYVDAQFHQSLVWILENSVNEMEELTFSTTTTTPDALSGNLIHITIDLKPNGREILVTDDNKEEFVQLMTDFRLKRDITEQSHHFVMGFREMIPLELLASFDECELELFVCGLVEIDVNDWKANTYYRGYSPNSPVIEWFWIIVQEMSMEDRVRLLQFVTGNTRLPPAGFQALISTEGNTKFQIHKSWAASNQLPIARTCFNRIDLPNYDSIDHLRKAIDIAIHEGLPGFGIA